MKMPPQITVPLSGEICNSLTFYITSMSTGEKCITAARDLDERKFWFDEYRKCHMGFLLLMNQVVGGMVKDDPRLEFYGMPVPDLAMGKMIFNRIGPEEIIDIAEFAPKGAC